MFFALLVFLVGCAFVGATSNEGTRFAFALAPNRYYTPHGELILSARQTTNVTITTNSTSNVVTVNGSTSYHFDQDMRTKLYIENKGIYITADEPIAAHVAANSSSFNEIVPDAILLRPITTDCSCLEYYLAGYEDEFSTLDKYYPMSYFMVVAAEDETEVDVHYNCIGLEDEHFTLHRFQVFTKDTNRVASKPKFDFTGIRIQASKPVFVESGDGHSKIYAQGGSTSYQHISESMPAINELGKEYTTFPLHFGGDGGYEVRVIAVNDRTDVSVPTLSVSLTLHAGDFHVIENNETRLAFKVHCSKVCMVMQYIKALPKDVETGYFMGAFMAALIPDERSSDSLIFTVPMLADFDASMAAAISINTNTFPVKDLYLNDTSLADLNWQPVEGSGMWSATMTIAMGFHHLYTTDHREKFTAYLYVASYSQSKRGFGFPIGYSDGKKPLSRQSTSSSPLHYRVVLFGNFTSPDGEAFTVKCTEALRENFQTKVERTVTGLNKMFGQSLCTYVDIGDVNIVSASSLLMISETTGMVDVSYRLQAASHVPISSLTGCAKELSVHLEDWTNWGRPVIPSPVGCQEAVFDPDFFFERPSNDNWVSLSEGSSPVLESALFVDAPLYSLSIYGDVTTRNREGIDVSCAYQYQQAWQTEVSEMTVTLNNEITAGRLCLSESGTFTVALVAPSVSFPSKGNRGVLKSTYFVKPTHDNLSFADVHDCVDEMFIFLTNHVNWGGLSFVLQQPLCPVLAFASPKFHK